MTKFQLKFLKLLMVPFSRWNAEKYLESDGQKFGKFNEIDLCVAIIVGARSGIDYRIPLIHIPYKDGVILVASQGGAPTHPQWYYNLLKTPRFFVKVKSEYLYLKARLATSEERKELWPLCVKVYSGYQRYQDRTKREIPLFICEP